MAVFVYSISQRSTLGLDVIRDRNRLYRETDEGLIENVYILKVLNMDAGHPFKLYVEGIEAMSCSTQTDLGRCGEVLELPVRLRADEADLKERSSEVVFELVSTDNPDLSVKKRAFWGLTGFLTGRLVKFLYY